MIEVLGQAAGYFVFFGAVSGAAYADHCIKKARFTRHENTAIQMVHGATRRTFK